MVELPSIGRWCSGVREIKQCMLKTMGATIAPGAPKFLAVDSNFFIVFDEMIEAVAEYA